MLLLPDVPVVLPLRSVGGDRLSVRTCILNSRHVVAEPRIHLANLGDAKFAYLAKWLVGRILIVSKSLLTSEIFARNLTKPWTVRTSMRS